MALKAILKSLEGLSEDVKKLYVKKDDVYHLDVEDLPEDPRLAEFRDNNRKLNKDLTDSKDALKKFEGIDVDKVKEWQDTEKKLRDKKLLDAGKVDELIASHLEPIKTEFKTQTETLKKENQQLHGQLATLMIDEQLTKLGATKGLRPTAIDDMLARGRKVFTLKDGKPAALGTDGAQILDKAGTPITMQTWLDSLSTDAPHLFQSSTGGGANGNNGNGNGNVKTMVRAEFDKLAPIQQRDFVTTQKGLVTD